MAHAETSPPVPTPDEPKLERSLASWRSLFNFLMTASVVLATLVATVPLFSVLVMLLLRGSPLAVFTELWGPEAPPWTWEVLGSQVGKFFSQCWAFPARFIELPPQAGSAGGGFGNAILGTIIMVGIAALLSVPFGILIAVYLAEFGKEGRTVQVVHFSAKVLTGLPSILAGVFAYALVVLTTGHFSAVAGGFALALLMLPTVILTAEEALKQVPRKMREAAYGMGATDTQVALKVVLPTAMPGILTGVMLAVARAAGETAPLLFTALFSDFWFKGNPMQPTASLAVLIFNFSNVPYPNQIEMAWSASLVLVVIVLTVNLIGQRLTRRSHPT
jgi:phosphate transport system permease protein